MVADSDKPDKVSEKMLECNSPSQAKIESKKKSKLEKNKETK